MKDYSKMSHRIETGGPRARLKAKLEAELDKVEQEVSHLQKMKDAMKK